MNPRFFETLERTPRAVLVTVTGAEGHTYARPGSRAVYAAGDPIPRWGNLGAGCVDAEAARWGEAVHADGRPRRERVDTRDPADPYTGTGTGCGGVLDLLVEAVTPGVRRALAEVRGHLEAGRACRIRHHADGHLVVAPADAPAAGRPPVGPAGARGGAPEDGPADAGGGRAPCLHVETVLPPRRLVLYGATPLAAEIVRQVESMAFAPVVVDWRPGYRDAFRAGCPVRDEADGWPFDARGFAVILSHAFLRDAAALRAALEAGCPFVGLLSSRDRRDRIFETLAGQGVAPEALSRVVSPVGLDLGGRTDPEIAASIVAQLVRAANRPESR